MRYLDLIRNRPEREQKPTQATVEAASQQRESDPNGFRRETSLAPFEVGDTLIYQVPGDPQEGPFEVVGISESRGQWWAMVAKAHSYAWIHECLLTKVQPQTQK